MNKKKLILGICLNAIVVIASLIGLMLNIIEGGFMSYNMWLYFTIQSNVWIASICLVFVILQSLMLAGKITNIANWLYIVKLVFTVSISLTFFVFLTMLTPQLILSGKIAYLATANNITLHFVSPIVAIIAFLITDTSLISNKCTGLFSAIPPLAYFIFVIILSIIPNNGFFKLGETTSKFPYFFMDYIKNGWFKIGNSFFEIGVFYWFIFLCVFIIGISYFYIFIQKKILLKQNTKHIKNKI